jgi:hypothetical protein
MVVVAVEEKEEEEKLFSMRVHRLRQMQILLQCKQEQHKQTKLQEIPLHHRLSK